MSETSRHPTSSDDEHTAHFNNNFADIDSESVPGMQATSNNTTTNVVEQPVRGRPHSRRSSLSDDFPEPTPSFTREPDSPGKRVTQAESIVSQSSSKKRRQSRSPSPSPSPSKRQRKAAPTEETERSSSPFLSPRPRSKSPESPSPMSRTIREQIEREALLSYFQEIEEDLICPICCDLYAAPQTGSPCGHSACGACFAQWIENKPHNPVCPICRAALYTQKSIIPNYALDTLVTKHIETLASKGMPDWQPDATRRIEWEARKDNWARDASKKREAYNAREARAMAYRIEHDGDDTDDEIEQPADVRRVLGIEPYFPFRHLQFFAEEDNNEAPVPADGLGGGPIALQPAEPVVQHGAGVVEGGMMPLHPPQPLVQLADIRRRRLRGRRAQFD